MQAATVETGFDADVDRLVKQSGQNVLACYQCLKCSSGCPAVEAGDYMPHLLVRRLQWGDVQGALSDPGLWSCLGCGTCGLRCPNDIAVDHVVDVLREWALQRSESAQSRTETFHESFLSTIRLYGRVHELTLIAHYKLRTRDWLSDIGAGLQMFSKGKIPFLPSRVRGRREVRELFKRAADRGDGSHDN